MVTDIAQLELSTSKDIWDRIAHETNAVMPFFSYEWYKTWTTVYSGHYEPLILHINNNSIAPFVRKGDVVQMTRASTDYNDLISTNKADIWPSILEYLKGLGIKRIEFENIDGASDTVSYFTELASGNRKISMRLTEQSPIIKLPTTFDEYLASISAGKRHRYRRFMRDHANLVIVKSTDPEHDIDIFIRLFLLNARKKALFTPEKEAFYRGIAKECNKYVWLQILYINDQPIASNFMYEFDKTVFGYNSGYDLVNYPNSGTYLRIENIKQAIERGFKYFNCLNGPQPYKYELGAVDTPLYSVSMDL